LATGAFGLATPRSYAHFLPNEITVPKEAIEWFKAHDYDMDAWGAGKLLKLSNKFPEDKIDDAIKLAVGEANAKKGST
jgi:hypothetical protein